MPIIIKENQWFLFSLIFILPNSWYCLRGLKYTWQIIKESASDYSVFLSVILPKKETNKVSKSLRIPARVGSTWRQLWSSIQIDQSFQLYAFHYREISWPGHLCHTGDWTLCWLRGTSCHFVSITLENVLSLSAGIQEQCQN